MWDNELLMFINETQLIERREGSEMSGRMKKKEHSEGEILRGSWRSSHKKKALFDFLLWDLLSLLKCLIGSINF